MVPAVVAGAVISPARRGRRGVGNDRGRRGVGNDRGRRGVGNDMRDAD